jgi:hypothetical protein
MLFSKKGRLFQRRKRKMREIIPQISRVNFEWPAVNTMLQVAIIMARSWTTQS